MNTLIKSKLNYILSNWPHGTVATLSWLKTQGVNKNLATAYKRSGWLKPLGHGAYTRFDNKRVEWTGGLYAVQTQLERAVHAGAATALDMQGYAHFLSPNNSAPVWLFANRGAKLPRWFKSRDWGMPVHCEETGLFGKAPKLGLTAQTLGDYSVTVAAPERAYLELLHQLPKQATFEAADTYGESLTTLRPDLLMELLRACRSIKVRRLFLYMARRHKHAWLKNMNADAIDLGSGKRVVARHGHYDARHQITVPKSFAEESHAF